MAKNTFKNMDKVEKLIEIVRSYSFLYDMGHKQYKNVVLKSETWESIGRELNESGESAMKKWKTVRDGYSKYKKQLKNATGSGKKNINYIWSSQLSFLDNFNGTRAPSANLSYTTHTSACTDTLYSEEVDTTANTSKSNSPLPSTSLPHISYQILPLESPANTSTASTPDISNRENKRSLDNRRDNDDVECVSQFQNAKKRIREYDVTDNLFLSYADTFKKFPPREQAIVKLELAKLFSSVELQLLDNG